MASSQEAPYNESQTAAKSCINEKRCKVTKGYIPQKGSAPYAVLLTLYRASQEGSEYMLKQELIDAAEASGLSRIPIQPAKASAPSGKFGSTKDWYSGWSSMKTLLTKGLVIKSSCPAKYKLTEEGKRAGAECFWRSGLSIDPTRNAPLCVNLSTETEANCSELYGRRDGISTHVKAANTPCSLAPSNTHPFPESVSVSESRCRSAGSISCEDQANGESDIDSICSYKWQMQPLRACTESKSYAEGLKSATLSTMPPLLPGSSFANFYDIIIVLDDREQFARDGKGLNSRTRFAERLKAQYKIEVEIRRLPVGDTIWLARHKFTKEEYVLDFVVERKNVNDLSSSIKDTRYKQQKLRLMRCGLRKLIYLVEGDPNLLDSAESIKTACFSTELVEGFDIQRTQDIGDTLRRYGELTYAIRDCYNKSYSAMDNPPQECRTYMEFLSMCTDLEKEKISDVFGAMLMQVKNVTESVALAVLEKYPTPLSLVMAYSRLDGDVTTQEQLLKGLPLRNENKFVSGITSKNIFKFMWST